MLGDRWEVEEADHGADALNVLTSLGAFDVAVVEVSANRNDNSLEGVAAIRALHKSYPALGIVAHAPRPDRQLASETLGAGALAFVAKSSPTESLAEAVDAAGAAERFIDPAMSGNGDTPLTPRQREILQLYADGHSTATVSARLGLSPETVRSHTKLLLNRLGARDRAHAVAIALRNGMIE